VTRASISGKTSSGSGKNESAIAAFRTVALSLLRNNGK
jgi:hypothetical protein